MFIKRITCKVKKEKKDVFSDGQAKWGYLNTLEGFVGQIGGWSDKQENTAYIFSLWQDKKSYFHFMKNEHDKIAFLTGQEGSISSISIDLFEGKFAIREQIGTISDFMNGDYIRFTNADVLEDRMAHFEEMQINVWNKNMSQEEGMLGGYFAKNPLNKRCLVLTGWTDKKAHTNYLRLIKESDVNVDVSTVYGDQFAVEKSWLLIK
ncbi:YdbC family protein [Shouchella clausii]